MKQTPRNPLVAVDIIVEMPEGVVFIERKNPPQGWAFPGGFVDYGESLETAARREAEEETSLQVELLGQFHTYSDPLRDPRQHTLSTVFIGRAQGTPRAQDDAVNWLIADPRSPPRPLAFDHETILADYVRFRKGETREEIFADRLRG
ncbi:MAG: NUDIX hydrolase [Desulfobacteraceae bacterium]|nr:NUDIX hydrolase [Desulfobacteraceae bacterium]